MRGVIVVVDVFQIQLTNGKSCIEQNKTEFKVVVQAKSLYRCLTSLAYFMIFLLEKYMIHILNLSYV